MSETAKTVIAELSELRSQATANGNHYAASCAERAIDEIERLRRIIAALSSRRSSS